MFPTVESIDPSYQPDAQNKRCALHAAAQRGLLDICYMLVQVNTYGIPFTNVWGDALKAAPNPVQDLGPGVQDLGPRT